jgi:hypothetical protein
MYLLCNIIAETGRNYNLFEEYCFPGRDAIHAGRYMLPLSYGHEIVHKIANDFQIDEISLLGCDAE